MAKEWIVLHGYVFGGWKAVFVQYASVCVVYGSFCIVCKAEAIVDGVFHVYFFESINVHVEDVDGTVIGFVFAIVNGRPCVWKHGVVVSDHLLSA